MTIYALLLLQAIVFVMSGADQNATCKDRCCVNYYRNKTDGLCVECPLGTHGLNCTETCPLYYYGRFCRSKCDCPSHLCDRKYGCTIERTTNGDSVWKNVALALIGSVTTVVLIGITFLLKFWSAKTCSPSRNLYVSNENQTENTEADHRYESRRSSHSQEEIGNSQPHGQISANDYTDLRRPPSVLSPIYDNPDDDKPNPQPNGAQDAAAKAIAACKLSSDEEDDSSEEEDDEEERLEDEGYGQLFKHETYNVLSLRRTFPDNPIHVRQVFNGKTIDDSSVDVQDGYQSIRLGASDEPKIDKPNEMSQSLSKKAMLRQSLITETIEEYIETSKVRQSLKVLEKSDGCQDETVTKNMRLTEDSGTQHSIGNPIRPYSLAKTNWSAEKNAIGEKIGVEASINEESETNEEHHTNIEIINEEKETTDGKENLQNYREDKCNINPEEDTISQPSNSAQDSPSSNYTQIFKNQLPGQADQESKLSEGTSFTESCKNTSNKQGSFLFKEVGKLPQNTISLSEDDDEENINNTSGTPADSDITYCAIKTPTE